MCTVPSPLNVPAATRVAVFGAEPEPVDVVVAVEPRRPRARSGCPSSRESARPTRRHPAGAWRERDVLRLSSLTRRPSRRRSLEHRPRTRPPPRARRRTRCATAPTCCAAARISATAATTSPASEAGGRGGLTRRSGSTSDNVPRLARSSESSSRQCRHPSRCAVKASCFLGIGRARGCGGELSPPLAAVTHRPPTPTLRARGAAPSARSTRGS